MGLNARVNTQGMTLTPAIEERIARLIRQLERRLVRFSEPKMVARFREEGVPRWVSLDMRLELGTRSGELVSHQHAETADHAMRLAIEDIERQLERRLARQRGEPSFGVPSRRLPKDLRPHRIGLNLFGGGEEDEVESVAAVP